MKRKLSKFMKSKDVIKDREYQHIYSQNFHLKIFAEQYLTIGADFFEFKFFYVCHVLKMILVSSFNDSRKELKNFYDENFKLLNITNEPINHEFDIKYFNKTAYNTMVKYAEILSEDFYEHVRVDLIYYKGNIFFGEVTFNTCGGLVPYSDNKWIKNNIVKFLNQNIK